MVYNYYLTVTEIVWLEVFSAFEPDDFSVFLIFVFINLKNLFLWQPIVIMEQALKPNILN